MTSLYGVKPEPMPINDQIVMAVIYLRGAPNPPRFLSGQPLSASQLEQIGMPTTLKAWLDVGYAELGPSSGEIVAELVDADGNSIPGWERWRSVPQHQLPPLQHHERILNWMSASAVRNMTGAILEDAAANPDQAASLLEHFNESLSQQMEPLEPEAAIAWQEGRQALAKLAAGATPIS